MQNKTGWLFTALAAMVLGGAAILVATAPSAGAAQGKDILLKEHWRNHDGRWSYYYPQDKCWYYTDGTHWYFEEKGVWKVYRYDRQFGKSFERGNYNVPGVNVKVQLPTHAVFRLF